MAKNRNRLTAVAIKHAGVGIHADGDGLYLQVLPSGGKTWILRFMLNGRAREMGLGSLTLVSLKEARDKAQAVRKQVHDHRIDPIDARRASRVRAVTLPFKDCAKAYIEAHKTGWRNAKHADQWGNTLETYAYPVFGDLPVNQIDTALVMRVLEPLWRKKTETASRLRGRIESVLSWATVRGYREGENPARWRGHLDKLLPKRSKVQKVQHHAALPYADLPSFYALLRQQPGVGALALRFAILAAARTGEVIGMRWEEVSLQDKVWTVPPERMKSGREHRVPLSTEAIRVLKLAEKGRTDDSVFVFETRPGKPLSSATMTAVLKRMERADLTVHGFRSTFRDCSAEQTNFPREIAEAALAHVLSNKAEAAYQRADLLEKRRKLMEHWGKFTSTPPAPQSTRVIPLKKAGKQYA